MKKNLQAFLVLVVLGVLWLLPGCAKPNGGNGAEPTAAGVRAGTQNPGHPVDPKKQNTQNGPITDGGGNAVGGKLFDFYENEGTTRLEMNLDAFYGEVNSKLLDENEVKELTDLLNQKLWAMDAHYSVIQNGQGVGRFLMEKMASTEKKWLFEPKEIDNKACLNRSVIDEKTQKIVACQSATEIRISAGWFKNEATLKSRAGLLVHETLLMVVQKTKPYSNEEEKVISENLVREINRQIFEKSTDKEMLSLFRQINVPVMTVLGQNLKISIEEKIPAAMCAHAVTKDGFALLKKNSMMSLLAKSQLLQSEFFVDEKEQKKLVDELLGYDPFKLTLPGEKADMTDAEIETFCKNSKIEGIHANE